MSKKTRTPVFVVITEDRYDVFGDPDSLWHGYLKAIIEAKGGPKNTVKPGAYSFTVERRGFKIYSVLKPME